VLAAGASLTMQAAEGASDQVKVGTGPDPPVCILAADSASALAESPRDPFGGPRYRLVSGSLPYFFAGA